MENFEFLWPSFENSSEAIDQDQSRIRRSAMLLCCKLAHLKPLEPLCMDEIFKNFINFTKNDQEAHFGLSDILWEQLLPHFLENSGHIIKNYFEDKTEELVELLALLLVSARHFDFRCVSRLTLSEAHEEKLWEALQKNENGLRSLIALNSSDLSSVTPELLYNVPSGLETVCSLRSLKSLYLSVGHILDEPALTSIGNNLLNLVSLTCHLNKGIQKEALHLLFANLKHLKEFRCNRKFEHLKSLLEMDHQLQVAGIEADSRLLLQNPRNPKMEVGHSTNGLQNPIPLEHLVLYKEGLGEHQMKMLPCVKHLKLVGWPTDPQMNDTLWRNLLDFKNLESLHFHNTNSIYLEFLEKFGPWLKGLSLVNVTSLGNPVLPMDRILRLCPRLETLVVSNGYKPNIQIGSLPLSPMKHLKKFAFIPGEFKLEVALEADVLAIEMNLHHVQPRQPRNAASGLLVHLLSSPELREFCLESVAALIDPRQSSSLSHELEHLASSGQIFQKLERCAVFNGEIVSALLHAPKFQGYKLDPLCRFHS